MTAFYFGNLAGDWRCERFADLKFGHYIRSGGRAGGRRYKEGYQRPMLKTLSALSTRTETVRF
jgi:hypothetical protein